MARKDSENQKKSMSKLFRGRAIFKPLNTGRIDERAALSYARCRGAWRKNILYRSRQTSCPTHRYDL